MSKPPKNAPPKAPPVASPKAPVAPAKASTPAPVPPVGTTPAATPQTSAPPPPPPPNQPENLTPEPATAAFTDDKGQPLADTPAPAPAKPKAKPAGKTQFVRVKAGPAPVAEGGLRHLPHSEFTIPRTRLPDVADIVTYVADVAD